MLHDASPDTFDAPRFFWIEVVKEPKVRAEFARCARRLYRDVARCAFVRRGWKRASWFLGNRFRIFWISSRGRCAFVLGDGGRGSLHASQATRLNGRVLREFL